MYEVCEIKNSSLIKYINKKVGNIWQFNILYWENVLWRKNVHCI